MKSYEYKKILIYIRGKIDKLRGPNISWILFAICIVLLILLIMPTVFQRYPFYNLINQTQSLPYELEIYGNITSNKSGDLKIYVGGYSANVEEDGDYKLNFLSSSKEYIPVCILDENNALVYYLIIKFDDDQWIKKLEIKIE